MNKKENQEEEQPEVHHRVLNAVLSFLAAAAFIATGIISANLLYALVGIICAGAGVYNIIQKRKE